MPDAIYQPEDQNPGLTPLPSATAPTQGFEAEARAGQGLVNVGGEADTLAWRLSRARDMTQESQAETQLLQAHESLQNKYTRDPNFNNYQTAPKAFQSDWAKTSSDIIAANPMSEMAAARINNYATRLGITGLNAIQGQAFQSEAQTNVANWQAQRPMLVGQYVGGSPQQQADVLARGAASIDRLAAAGWINPETAQREKASFAEEAQTTAVAKLMQTDPQAAKAALADPSQFPAIPAPKKIELQNGAISAVNEAASLRFSVLGKQDPAAAIAGVGTVNPGDVGTLSRVFDRGVIGQESNGNAAIGTNAQGASGLAQLEAGTAREAARRMGRNDIAAMPDGDLQRWLADPANAQANHDLGFNEFQTLVRRYDGNIPLALAGYNAGPGVADRMAAQAKAQFGDHPTPAQIASLAPSDETRKYIPAVYARLGAPMDQWGASGPFAPLRLQEASLNLSNEEQASQGKLLDRAASLERGDDPILDQVKSGAAFDPAALQHFINIQSAAAANGDGQAAQSVRAAERLQREYPVMQQAFQMPPAQLSAQIDQLQTAIRASPTPSLQQVETLDAMTRVDASNRAFKDNPIGLGQRAGSFVATPVDPSTVGSSAFGDALAVRGPQAAQAAGQFGSTPNPLQPSEAEALKTAAAQMSPSQKAAMFGQAAANLKDPAVYQAFVRQVAGDDHLAATAGQVAARDPQTAEKILTGAEMLKDKGVEEGVKKALGAFTETYPTSLYPTPGANSDAINAGMAVYAANKGAAHALIDPGDVSGMKAAMEEVTGKQIWLNGAVTPVPKPFTEGGVRFALSNLSEADLKPFGGLQPGVDADWLRDHAQLQPRGLGRTDYAVTVAGQAVKTASGANLVVDLDHFAAAQRARLDAEQNAATLQGVRDRQPGAPPPAPDVTEAPGL